MVEERDSKEYSWKWVTANELLSKGSCELLYALHNPSAIASSTSAFYDGESTKGTKIVDFRVLSGAPVPFLPARPIYCRKGLYFQAGDSLFGVFVQWRDLGPKG